MSKSGQDYKIGQIGKKEYQKEGHAVKIEG